MAMMAHKPTVTQFVMLIGYATQFYMSILKLGFIELDRFVAFTTHSGT